MTGPPTPPGGGERRRALQAERERTVENPGQEERPPPAPPALVRPYARMAAPTAPLPVVDEPGSQPPSSDDTVGPPREAEAHPPEEASVRQADPDVDTAARSDPPDDHPPDDPRDDQDAVLEIEDRLGDLSSRETDADGDARDDAPDDAAMITEAADPAEAAEPDAPVSETRALPPTPPEMAPPDWSAFTPVVPPGPLPFDTHAPSAGEWEHVSVREEDDGSWVRGLREAAGAEPWPELLSGPDVRASADEAEPPSEPPAEPPSEARGDEVRAEDSPDDAPSRGGPSAGPARPRRLSQALFRDADEAVEVESADGLVTDEEGPPEDSASAPRAPSWSDEVEVGAPAWAQEPDADGKGSRPTTPEAAEGPDDEEPVRGTLAPVLRRSTERARYPTSSTPVIRPPVLPQPPGEPPAPPASRGGAVSWEEALARAVVPGSSGWRQGRRVAKARHESGGTGEYRPRATPDRSLTLLVVGMILVLILLVGVAVWAFWPRVSGTRSLPGSLSAAPATTGAG